MNRKDPGLRHTRASIALRMGYVLMLVYGFLISIRLMGSAIKALGSDTAQNLFSGISNPFAGLAVGTLATVLVQSSSTSTATIVSLGSCSSTWRSTS
jgi:sodium-dependent phosphate cotransporter